MRRWKPTGMPFEVIQSESLRTMCEPGISRGHQWQQQVF